MCERNEKKHMNNIYFEKLFRKYRIYIYFLIF